jgi:hypothetical protein
MPRFKKTQPPNKPYKKVNQQDTGNTTLKVWHPGTIPTETVIERILTFFNKRIESFNPESLEFSATRQQAKKGRHKDGTSIIVTEYLLIIKTKKYLADLLGSSHLLQIRHTPVGQTYNTYDEIIPGSWNNQLVGSFSLSHAPNAIISTSIIRKGLNNLGTEPFQIKHWRYNNLNTKVEVTFKRHQDLLHAIELFYNQPILEGLKKRNN